MAAPTYTTDLQTFDLAEDTGAWAEFADMSGGGSPAEDDEDNEIQGLFLTSQTANTTGLVSLGKLLGSPVTLSAGEVFLVWHQLTSPGAMETYANGGMRLVVGTDEDNWKAWAVGGKLTSPNPYGGWQNNPIDPTITYEYLLGTPPTTDYYMVGCACNLLSGIFKGNPHQCDAIRYGRAESRMNGGEAADYAIFAGFAAKNDANDATNGYNRWGLIQAVAGGFLWKGLMVLGYTSAVDFRDLNTTIFIQDTRKVDPAFNRIEVRQSGSRVDWTGISFIALGVVSRGTFEAVDDADINIDSCTFTGMNTFIFQLDSSVVNSIFDGCNLITSGGGIFTGSKILASTVDADASAFGWNVATDPDGYMDDMTFSKGTNAHHAIELGTSSPLSVTLRGMTFTGFNVSDEQNDSVIHVLRDTGTVTINAVGCTGTVSYKSAGATVNVVVDPVTLAFHVQDSVTLGDIVGAAVMAKCAAGGSKPYQASVSIVASGTTATVTHNGHGLVTNDYVIIEGCAEGEYNGGWQITWASVDTYTYTMIGSPSSPATGTPVSTFAPIYGVTDGSGNISDSRTYASDQPFTGRVRKATGAPLYKTQPISGTIDNVAGLSVTVNMISDD